MPETTSRLQLPLLATGQAQKEVTHNETLILVDALLSPVVEEVAPSTIPAAPNPGQCWIVGPAPTGVWSGKAKAIACWTSGGWRFVNARPGLSVWCSADNVSVQYDGTDWVKGQTNALAYHIGGQKVVGARSGAIPNPSGGAVADAEARIALGAILSALRTHGLIAT